MHEQEYNKIYREIYGTLYHANHKKLTSVYETTKSMIHADITAAINHIPELSVRYSREQDDQSSQLEIDYNKRLADMDDEIQSVAHRKAVLYMENKKVRYARFQVWRRKIIEFKVVTTIDLSSLPDCDSGHILEAPAIDPVPDAWGQQSLLGGPCGPILTSESATHDRFDVPFKLPTPLNLIFVPVPHISAERVYELGQSGFFIFINRTSVRFHFLLGQVGDDRWVEMKF